MLSLPGADLHFPPRGIRTRSWWFISSTAFSAAARSAKLTKPVSREAPVMRSLRVTLLSVSFRVTSRDTDNGKLEPIFRFEELLT